MNEQYLLDTCTASALISNEPGVRKKTASFALAQLSISVITEAELRFGVEKKPGASRLQKAVLDFLSRILVLPWTREDSIKYASLRAQTESKGLSVDGLDLLIATQAYERSLILVTNDNTLKKLKPWIKIEDWITRKH